jgi:hypothetical protein
MTRQAPLFVTAFILTLVGLSAAQTAPRPGAKEGGITSYIEFGGTTNSDGQVFELNSNVGYDLNSHFGFAVGAPIYFVSPSPTTGASSANGLGDPYLTLHLRYANPLLNFASALTGTAPIGNSKEGLSTGRATFDWTNRVDHSFSNLTPFVELGVANTTPQSRLFLRPYTTLGFNAHFQGGASYDVWKFIAVGASGYDILPTGQQTIFSRVNSGQAAAGNGHGPAFLNNQQTTGTASIAQDDGCSVFIDVTPQRSVDLELGFTRSFVYNLNSISFNIGFNLGQLYRKSQK